MLALLKSKAIALGAIVISALLVTIKFLSASRAKAVKEARQMKAALTRQKNTQDIDNELEGQLSSHRAEIKKAIKEGKPVKSLENPNDF